MSAPYKIINLKAHSKKNRAIALGNFDGIHKGHQKILKATQQKPHLISSAITFCEPPIKWFQPEIKIELITTLEERLELFCDYGIEEAIIFDFGSIKELSALEYLNFLKNELNCKFLSCGLNHSFGKNKEGNLDLLKSFREIESAFANYALSENQEIISSSLIRNKMQKEPIQNTNKLLGHNFLILGNLIGGLNLGSKLGFPTLNLNYPAQKIKPQMGVYAAFTHFSNKQILPSAVNFGFSPTLKQIDNPILESHLLIVPEEKDLPKIDEKLKIELIEFIRPEKHFSSPDQLKKQIAEDCSKIKNLLGL